MNDFTRLFHSGGGSQIMMGSVGWEGEDDYYFLGTEENDGYTLIRVQLFEGRDNTKPINPNRAQGHKILCQLSSGLFRIPGPDTRVYVAVPQGMEHVNGAGVIFAAVEKSPTTQFTGDRAVLDFGPDHHVVIKGKSVSVSGHNNDFVSVGEPRSGGAPGITLSEHNGSTIAVQDGVIGMVVPNGLTVGTIFQMTPSVVESSVSGGASFMINSIKFQASALSGYLTFGLTYWGMAPVAGNFAKYHDAILGDNKDHKLIFVTTSP